MSRTRKGNKPVGYDYWGKRALSGCCGYGPDVKRMTHKIERARSKQKLSRELADSALGVGELETKPTSVKQVI